jgi:GntR family transcriptional repressor for pyruvate dehydrogenase complex
VNRAQLRQPRLAEMVADILRERIISGQVVHCGKLATQEDLLAAFNVS